MSTSPTQIGRYQVVRRIGSGGMGSVFLARDPELDRAVAIKLVKDDLTDDPELRERFSREARSAARLRHPNIITIFDIGEHEGRPFIAMEYLPGESLADIIRRQPAIELSRVLRWMESLSRGLAHAHRAGIVHRDIKPANLMVDPDGVLKIVDFGIARLGDSSLTRDGMLVGTANYMAPEQLLGSGADERCDIFAFGAVFYELLTARKAFPGTIADGLFNRICHEPPEPLAKLCPDLDRVQRIVAMALEKDRPPLPGPGHGRARHRQRATRFVWRLGRFRTGRTGFARRTSDQRADRHGAPGRDAERRPDPVPGLHATVRIGAVAVHAPVGRHAGTIGRVGPGGHARGVGVRHHTGGAWGAGLRRRRGDSAEAGAPSVSGRGRNGARATRLRQGQGPAG